MSEIEKMYENAGIEQTQDTTCGDCEFVNYPEENKPCNACTQYGIKHHPPFTAEKQIELIKLLSYYYNITISKNFENDYKFQCEGDDVRPYVFTSGQNFAEQLAAFLNMCYEYLPEEEKQQVKGILE